MTVEKKIKNILKFTKKISLQNSTKTGFIIGNTAKLINTSNYFTPVRNLGLMTAGGAIVYSEKQAKKISKLVDGKVDYILVDVEKKIPDNKSIDGETANTERVVRENTHKSKLLVYKGNDLSVDAVDSFLSHYYKDSISGLGGKKIVIIGSGNLGSKLALKLVERGANVTITRRNKKKLEIITKALNYIKPKYTKAKVTFSTNNLQAIKNTDILIGATNGIEAITKLMIEPQSSKCLIIEAGKGSIAEDAINLAKEKKLNVFRLDITHSLIGLISSQLSLEEKISKKMGRKILDGVSIVSGGLLAFKDEIVVDDINNPQNIYGIADGKGDFLKKLNSSNLNKLKKIKQYFKT